MSRLYRGRKARVIGALGGLLMLSTGVGMYVFMGATASNVPLPSALLSLIHGLIPALRPAADQPMPLVLLAIFGTTSVLLTGIGLRNTVEALVEDDYTVRVR